MAIVQNGSPETWNWGAYGDGDSATAILNLLGKHLKITKNCGKNGGCFKNVTYRNLNNTANWRKPSSWDKTANARLADGFSIWIFTYSTNYGPTYCSANFGSSKLSQHICGEIGVDINGDKGPNQIGRDMFLFYVSKYGMALWGGPDSSETYKNLTTYCNKDSGNGWNGSSCAAWIIKNDNMDYIKRNVS